MRKVLIDSAKLAISAGLIWFSFSAIDSASAFAMLRSIHPGVVIFVITSLIVQHIIGGFRFHRLMALVRVPIGLLAAVDSVFVGVFFGQVFISFIGGDAMRVWRMAAFKVPVSRAFEAILFDRVTGFVALIALIVLGMPLLFGIMTDITMRVSLVAAVFLGVLGTLVFLFVNRLPLSLRRWRAFRAASDISTLALSISGRLAEVSYLLGMSLVIQLVNVIAIFAIAIELGANARFVDFLVLVPPVMLLAMLPISFAGWGVREGAMAVALGLVGISAEQSIAISVSFGLGMIVAGLPGGFVWLIVRKPSSDRGATATRITKAK